MYGWNQEKVDALMYGISRSYPTAGPLEISIGLVLCLALASVLYFHYKYRIRVQHHFNARQSERLWNTRIQRLQLTSSEITLLEFLRESLSSKYSGGHNLFIDHKLYQTISAQVLQEYPDLAFRLHALEIRLGLTNRVSGRKLGHSNGIPIGTEFFLGEGTIFARVVQVLAEGIIACPLQEKELNPPIHMSGGTQIVLYLCRSDGYYQFETNVLVRPNGFYLFAHQAKLSRVHRRMYNRHLVELSGLIADLHIRIMNLSGGGALVSLPSNELPVLLQKTSGENESVAFEIYLGQAHIKTNVAIVAIASNHLHLEFKNIREGDRDRLIAYLHGLYRQNLVDSNVDS